MKPLDLISEEGENVSLALKFLELTMPFFHDHVVQTEDGPRMVSYLNDPDSPDDSAMTLLDSPELADILLDGNLTELLKGLVFVVGATFSDRLCGGKSIQPLTEALRLLPPVPEASTEEYEASEWTAHAHALDLLDAAETSESRFYLIAYSLPNEGLPEILVLCNLFRVVLIGMLGVNPVEAVEDIRSRLFD